MTENEIRAIVRNEIEKALDDYTRDLTQAFVDGFKPADASGRARNGEPAIRTRGLSRSQT